MAMMMINFPVNNNKAALCLLCCYLFFSVIIQSVAGHPLHGHRHGHYRIYHHRHQHHYKHNLNQQAGSTLPTPHREHYQPYVGSSSDGPKEWLQGTQELSQKYERRNDAKVSFPSPPLAQTSGKDNKHHLQKRQFQCNPLAPGLTALDCIYLSEIGLLAQGPNPLSPTPSPSSSSSGDDDGDTISRDGKTEHAIWIGSQGPNIFTFINSADVPVILILWYQPPLDDQASFMNAREPAITYSLPTTGSAVQISIANNVPGGWAVIYNRSTTLTEYGQVDNTFGEFSTGPWATIDVSRLVNMQGDGMSVSVFGSGFGEEQRGQGTSNRDGEQKPSGVCVSDMSTCVYACNDGMGTSCGGEGTYSLLNCQGQPGAVQSWDADGNPTGGCQGWSWGGTVNVVLTRRGQQGVGSWTT